LEIDMRKKKTNVISTWPVVIIDQDALHAYFPPFLGSCMKCEVWTLQLTLPFFWQISTQEALLESCKSLIHDASNLAFFRLKRNFCVWKCSKAQDIPPPHQPSRLKLFVRKAFKSSDFYHKKLHLMASRFANHHCVYWWFRILL
jgi:hypothetical protein